MQSSALGTASARRPRASFWRGRRVAVLIAFVAMFAGGGRRVHAQPVSQGAPPHSQPRMCAGPGAALVASVLTFGPGDHPFFKFGHNAVWIHDESAPRGSSCRDRVYNYGTFAFDSAGVIPKFFLGRFQYWLSHQSYAVTESIYKRENRSIDLQVLDLVPEDRALLRDVLELNSREESKRYKYDYYRDNCSTRVRDVLDKVTACGHEAGGDVCTAEQILEMLTTRADEPRGRLRAAVEGPGSMSYRAHTLRLTHDLAIEYVVLDFALGPLVDEPITLWEETFLPGKLQDLLRATTLVGPDGSERPLVKIEKNIFTAKRPPELATYPNWWPWYLLVGATLGGAFALLGRLGSRRTVGRVLTAVSLSLLGLVAGLLSIIFVLIWLLTDHAVGYRNENILQLAPWLVALPFFSVGLVKARLRTTRRVFKLLLAAAAASALGVILKLLPWFHQDNWRMAAFALPLWGGAAFGAHQLLVAARARAGAVDGALPDDKERLVVEPGPSGEPGPGGEPEMSEPTAPPASVPGVSGGSDADAPEPGTGGGATEGATTDAERSAAAGASATAPSADEAQPSAEESPVAASHEEAFPDADAAPPSEPAP